MESIAALVKAQPAGEHLFQTLRAAGSWPVDPPGGRFFAEWETQTPVTREGQLMFFFQFLQVGDRWKDLMRECPLSYTGNPGSGKLNVMGELDEQAVASDERHHGAMGRQGEMDALIDLLAASLAGRKMAPQPPGGCQPVVVGLKHLKKPPTSRRKPLNHEWFILLLHGYNRSPFSFLSGYLQRATGTQRRAAAHHDPGEQAALLLQLGWTLPEQPPPRITSAQAQQAG